MFYILSLLLCIFSFISCSTKNIDLRNEKQNLSKIEIVNEEQTKHKINIGEINKDIFGFYVKEESIEAFYERLDIGQEISFEAFKKALAESDRVKNANKILTVVDFSKPSDIKRMCIIDMNEKKVLLKTYCSHGRRSGDLYALHFSNKNGSYKSSVGLFVTGKAYNGRNGNSLELFGLDKGRNDNARKRTIVVHGASYASENFLKKYGRLGRSLGCFVVPPSLNNKVISMIEGRTIFYVYSKNL